MGFNFHDITKEIFGSDKKETKSSSSSTTDSSVTESNKINKTGTTTESQSQTVNALDQQTTGLLTGLLTSLVTSGQQVDQSAQIGDILNQLQARAQTTEADINSQIGAIIEENRRQGELDLGRTVTDLAQSTGSAQNTYVAQVGAEGRAALESQLAATGAEYAIKAREAQTQDLQNLIASFQTGNAATATGTNAVAQLANVLKGATVQTTGQSTQQTQEQQLIDILKTLVSQTDTTGKNISEGNALQPSDVAGYF